MQELGYYQGRDGRTRFFQAYQSVGTKEHTWEAPTEHTPMAVMQEYLKGVITRNRVPVPAVLRQTRLKELNLSGMGLGDDYLAALGEVIEMMPYLESISVQNNRLTDAGLSAVLTPAFRLKALERLNLSENEVGERSSKKLLRYLIDPSCLLKSLTLAKADVDDEECRHIMEALEVNRSVTELDVSNNLIGRSEQLNIVQPDLVTGGEATGAMLRVNTTLKTLNLRWNSLRAGSAMEIAQALADNSTLTHLDLSQNAFADMPSQ